MRNNHTLEIVGVGTVRIKLFDGIIRTIQGVRHVKGLKKLIVYWIIGQPWVQHPYQRWSFKDC